MPATRDTFWQGRLTVWQPSRGHGYRFNLDAVHLAAFAPLADVVVDLGAGVGIVGLLLLASGKARRVVAVERQPEMAALARRNAADNGLAARMQVIEGDLRHVTIPAGVTLVVANPPYVPAGAGRPSPNVGRDEARTERHGTLADFLAAANRSGARQAAMILPAHRAGEVARLGVEHGLGTANQRLIVPRASRPPSHVLWLGEAGTQGAGTIRAPLVVHDEAGALTAEVSPWVAGEVRHGPAPAP